MQVAVLCIAIAIAMCMGVLKCKKSRSEKASFCSFISVSLSRCSYMIASSSFVSNQCSLLLRDVLLRFFSFRAQNLCTWLYPPDETKIRGCMNFLKIRPTYISELINQRLYNVLLHGVRKYGSSDLYLHIA